MGFPFYIARRYLFARKSHNVINVVSGISSAGIAVGTAAMIMILSVFNGFNVLITKMISPVEPDLAIVPTEGKFFTPDSEVFDWLYDNHDIKSMCPILEDHVFLSYEDRQGTATVKGVDLIYLQESGLQANVFDGDLVLSKGEIPYAAVGAGLASRMGINPRFIAGIDLYYPDREGEINIANPMGTINFERVYPSCRFSLGAEIDNKLMLIDISKMRDLTGCLDEVSSVELRVKEDMDKASFKKLKDRINSRLSDSGAKLVAKDRYEQNPDLYRMLRMEKASVYMIMLFVTIILGFSIFGCLSLLVIEKRDNISTLRAMGADSVSIRRIFTLEGWMITLSGMVVGLALGSALCLLQQYTGLVSMPGDYIVSAYPVCLKLSDVAISAGGIALVGWVIARLSTRFV